MSATIFGDEPFVTAAMDLFIIDSVISENDDIPFSRCCCSLIFYANFVETYQMHREHQKKPLAEPMFIIVPPVLCLLIIGATSFIILKMPKTFVLN
jgi:hypothetical protein